MSEISCFKKDSYNPPHKLKLVVSLEIETVFVEKQATECDYPYPYD